MNAGIHSAPRVENAPMILEQGGPFFRGVMIPENVPLYSAAAVLIVMNTGMSRMCKALHGRLSKLQ
jgi:hypothetical protein